LRCLRVEYAGPMDKLWFRPTSPWNTIVIQLLG